MRWVRSYYDAEAQQMTCYYEADSADDIRQHAAFARLVCDHVSAVTEYLPAAYE